MKVVIFEDEELSALKLQNMLLQIDRDIEVMQVIGSVKSGIDFIKKNTEIDLIFLDIQLSDGIGLHILEETKTTIPIDQLIFLFLKLSFYPKKNWPIKIKNIKT